MTHNRSLFRRAHRALMGGVAIGSAVACGMDKAAFAPVTNPRLLLEVVRLDNHAYNLGTIAPYNRVQLQATALMADGSPAPGSLRYTVKGDTMVTVDSTGLVTVRGATTSDAVVSVSLTVGGMTISDGAYVIVTDGAPAPVHHIRIEPMPGDSAVQSLYWRDVRDGGLPQKILTATAYDAVGNPLAVVLSFASSDTTIATVDNAVVQSRNAGRTWISVSTFANGRVFTDSLLFRVDSMRYYMVQGEIVTTTRNGVTRRQVVFYPERLTVPTGTDVTFIAPDDIRSLDAKGDIQQGSSIDIVFDDSSAVEASVRVPVNFFQSNNHGGRGNIPAFRYYTNNLTGEFISGQETRLFARLGRYTYHTSDGGGGEIIVQ